MKADRLIERRRLKPVGMPQSRGVATDAAGKRLLVGQCERHRGSLGRRRLAWERRHRKFARPLPVAYARNSGSREFRDA